MASPPRGGHIKLARKMFDEHDLFWGDGTKFDSRSAWIDVLQMAAWRATTYRGTDKLSRGEFVASVRFLAQRWGWSKSAVQRWFARVSKAGRIAGQRAGHHGMIYLVVNYDTYQTTPAERGTPDGTDSGTEVGQERDTKRDKEESSKAVKQEKTPAVGASGGAKYRSFPVPECTALYKHYTATVGAVDYGRFRKAFAPLYPVDGPLYTTDQLTAAITEAFEDAQQEAEQGNGYALRQFSPETVAGRIGHWVEVASQPLVVDGVPTARAMRVLGTGRRAA